MDQWLAAPGGWLAPISAMGACLALAGALLLDHVQSTIAGFRRTQGSWSIQLRMIAGHLAGVPIAIVLLVIATQQPDATARALFAALALLAYLFLGLVLPRRPIVQAQQERRRIRLLLPSFISFLRTALYGPESRPVILQRYALRDDARLKPMQDVVADALDLVTSRGRLPFEALLEVARDRGVPELIDVALVLRQAESQGSDPRPVLEQSETLIAQILYDEFRKMIERRKLYLLALGALSVVGILIQILFVIVVGGGVLERL